MKRIMIESGRINQEEQDNKVYAEYMETVEEYLDKYLPVKQ